MSDSISKWDEMEINKKYNWVELQKDNKPDVAQREQDMDVSFVPKDQIVEKVINTFRERSAKGINKYGTTLFDSNENCLAFINHLQEELMDAVLYAEKLKSFFK